MLIRDCQCPPDTLLALAAARPQDFPILLDSAASGALSRWSILAAFPNEVLSAGAADAPAFLPALAARLAATGRDRIESHESRASQQLIPGSSEGAELPFTGGWFVYLGYELAGEVEPTLVLQPSPHKLRGCALRTPAALLWDAAAKRGYAVAESPALLAELLAAPRACPSNALQGELPPGLPAKLIEAAPEIYLQAVKQAQQHIRAGNIYQANLSRGWRTAWPPQTGQAADAAPSNAVPSTSLALYLSLRAANPAPFAAWARLPGLEILSSSPERLVSVLDGEVETRPIAGTRPRAQAGDGAAEIAAMLASPKERAEHTMLIDLERNDLGRVCAGGSVEVAEFMVTESYAHVHHIVSSVRGRLRESILPVEVLRAVFPGGTITGCPKVRCMQLIADLEGQGRGAYTGSLGYINHNGNMDFNILIRTLTIADGVLSFRAGAGIVADSDPELELAETRAKALGMIRALAGGAP